MGWTLVILLTAAVISDSHSAELFAQLSDFTGRVVAATDGDTIHVLREGREGRVRLDGIDAPESGEGWTSTQTSSSTTCSTSCARLADHLK